MTGNDIARYYLRAVGILWPAVMRSGYHFGRPADDAPAIGYTPI